MKELLIVMFVIWVVLLFVHINNNRAQKSSGVTIGDNTEISVKSYDGGGGGGGGSFIVDPVTRKRLYETIVIYTDPDTGRIDHQVKREVEVEY